VNVFWNETARIPPLQCNRQLLEQVESLSIIASDACRPSSDLLDQFNGFLVPGYRRFDDQKYVGTGLSTTEYVGKRLYMLILSAAACSAAASASMAELITCALAKVSGTVMSHTTVLLLAQDRKPFIIITNYQ